jgi:hypothetical protein
MKVEIGTDTLEALVWEDILNEDPLVYGSVKKTIETYALPGLGEATVISSVNNFWKTRGIVS